MHSFLSCWKHLSEFVPLSKNSMYRTTYPPACLQHPYPVQFLLSLYCRQNPRRKAWSIYHMSDVNVYLSRQKRGGASNHKMILKPLLAECWISQKNSLVIVQNNEHVLIGRPSSPLYTLVDIGITHMTNASRHFCSVLRTSDQNGRWEVMGEADQGSPARRLGMRLVVWVMMAHSQAFDHS